MCKKTWLRAFILVGMIAASPLVWPHVASAQEESAGEDSRGNRPDFPPHAEVLKGYEKVISTLDGKPSLYTLWKREKDGQIYAELPKKFASQKYFIALTKSSGERFAGLQFDEMYGYWRRYDNRLALIAANVNIRSTGDDGSKASVKRLFTDQVLLDVPIVTMGPGGGPVIDMDDLLVKKAPIFFGASIFDRNLTPRLYKIAMAKAFPENVEIAFEIPNATGRLQTIHYSFSTFPDSSDYKPRVADERVGYFITSYDDYGKYQDDEVTVRYINRWNLQKADPSLKVSPPKKPIVFYIEHTTPIRYRHWVREGILAWNEAFEKVGISNAIEVYYQDATTGAHMDKDPEDVRYNFVRWLNNDISTAIGPSRAHPLTGEIVDADIILTDGWIRYYRVQFEDMLPKVAMEGLGPETRSWLAKHPNWDPRIRLAPASERAEIQARLATHATSSDGVLPADARDFAAGMSDDDSLGGHGHANGGCLAAEGKAFDMALMSMTLSMMNDLRAAAEEAGQDDATQSAKSEDSEEVVDGMPLSFVGPLLANLVAHEVGHTLGLRHNFKGSAIHPLEEINSKKIAGKSNLSSSVMDYTPVNIRMKSGEMQGDYTMDGVGDYDMWAIEYGYSLESDLKPILSRAAEPRLQYATDEDTGSLDPLARRYDFSADPLDYAEDQMELMQFLRARIIDQFVKDGDSWSKANSGYLMTLYQQTRLTTIMSGWIGGAYVYRDKKGDPDGRPPLEVVPAEKQRKALDFVIKNTFHDESYGLTPDLMVRLVRDRWPDAASRGRDADYPVHDRILGLQASALTMIMNPDTLRRVYDNEFRLSADEDAFTLPELLDTVRKDIWSELGEKLEEPATPRKPMISSLRRNLQLEHLTHLIDLSLPGAGSGAAYKPISTLAMEELRKIRTAAQACREQNVNTLDAYTLAHLSEVERRIEKAMNAEFIYNASDIGG